MTHTFQSVDRRILALDIQANPVDAYDNFTRQGWGNGLGRWVPRHMRAAVARYVIFGTPPGSFLRAIIEGDYFEASTRADDTNRAGLWGYSMFFHNYAPGGCFGSPAHFSDWHKAGGMLGHDKADEPC